MWLIVPLLLVIFATVLLGMKNVAFYLAVNEPNQGDYLVVEGWQSEHSLKQALAVFQNGSYQYLITTGGPDSRRINPEYKTYAEQSANFLLSQGLDATRLIVIPAPASAQDRTFLSAVMVRNWFISRDNKSLALDVFTQGVHARRTYTLYKMAFRKSDEIGIYASEPNSYELKRWWQTSEGAKSVVTEVVGMVWVKCCFNSGVQGSHQEKWGLIKTQE